MKHMIRAMAMILLLAAFIPAAQAATYDYNYDFEVTGGDFGITIGNNYASINLWTTNNITIDYTYDNEMAPGAAYEGVYSYFLELEIKDVPLLGGIYHQDFGFDTDKSDEDFSMDDGFDISSYYGAYVDATTISYEKYGLYNVDVSYAYAISGSGDSLAVQIYYLTLEGGNLSSVLNGLVDEYDQYGVDLEGETLAATIKEGYGILQANEVTASEVPVPAAVWLLGSGLLGLAGLKRKKA